MEDSYTYADLPAGDGESASPGRLGSLDAYRGIAMFLMVAEALHLCHVAEHFHEHGGGNRIWDWLCVHQSHVAWVGCSLHDMIQPSFTFMVGVSLPFSLASRRSKGQSMGWLTAHAFWRAALLVFLGIFLRSQSSDITNFTFDDTLTQIGLGYGFLFILGQFSKRSHWIWLAVILVGYWAAFAIYPAPGENFDYESVGVPSDWPHLMNGFESHWNKNSNLAHAFDVWWMNLFPRTEPFTHSGGGYQTLSFIPTLATMIMGLIAGGVLRTYLSHGAKIGWLLLIGVVFLGAGFGLELSGLCPLVKRIWTPSWALYSGGWCFVIIATLYLIIDVVGLRVLAFPFIVIGMNSIAIYCMSWTVEGYIHDALHRHFGWLLGLVAEPYDSLVAGGPVVLIMWLILLWMYRRKVFLRI